MSSRTAFTACIGVIVFGAALGLAPRVAGQAPPATPATGARGDAALPGLPPSEVPAEVAWGPGRDVQAGLVLSGRYGRPDQHTGLYVFGVYLRNRTERALTVRCPSFPGLSVPSDDTDYTTLVQSPLLFCSPNLRDSRGKPVDVAYRPGADERRYALRPGQAALVSHWMLRTMGRGAKGAATAGYRLVAFVEPGTYRLTCDVSASWDAAERRARPLRTGEVPFAVTGADLERGTPSPAAPDPTAEAVGRKADREPDDPFRGAAIARQEGRPGEMAQPAQVTPVGGDHFVVSEPAVQDGVPGLLLTSYRLNPADGSMTKRATTFHRLAGSGPGPVVPGPVAPGPAKRLWGPEQAAGEPDTKEPEDLPTAWASETADDQDEWLTLEYAEAVVPATLRIYETYNPGAVNKVSVFLESGKEVVLWEGKDPSPQTDPMGVSKIPLRRPGFSERVRKVKIYVDSKAVPGWNEIDAVELVDREGRGQWATSATASSTYADRAPEAPIAIPRG